MATDSTIAVPNSETNVHDAGPVSRKSSHHDLSHQQDPGQQESHVSAPVMHELSSISSQPLHAVHSGDDRFEDHPNHVRHAQSEPKQSKHHSANSLQKSIPDQKDTDNGYETRTRVVQDSYKSQSLDPSHQEEKHSHQEDASKSRPSFTKEKRESEGKNQTRISDQQDARGPSPERPSKSYPAGTPEKRSQPHEQQQQQRNAEPNKEHPREKVEKDEEYGEKHRGASADGAADQRKTEPIPENENRRSSITSKRIVLLKNGDKYHRGLPIVLNERKIKTWENLLLEWSDKIKPGFGAVRRIFTLTGAEITQIDQLEPNGVYVVSGAEKFRSIPNGYKADSEVISAHFNHAYENQKPSSSAKQPTVYRELPVTYSGGNLPDLRHQISQVLTIYVHKNGDNVNPPMKITLKKYDLWNITRAKDAIGEKVNPVGGFTKSIRTLEGTPVDHVADLKQGEYYVLVGPYEKFHALNYTPEGRRDLLVPIRRSSQPSTSTDDSKVPKRRLFSIRLKKKMTPEELKEWNRKSLAQPTNLQDSDEPEEPDQRLNELHDAQRGGSIGSPSLATIHSEYTGELMTKSHRSLRQDTHDAVEAVRSETSVKGHRKVPDKALSTSSWEAPNHPAGTKPSGFDALESQLPQEPESRTTVLRPVGSDSKSIHPHEGGKEQRLVSDDAAASYRHGSHGDVAQETTKEVLDATDTEEDSVKPAPRKKKFGCC